MKVLKILNERVVDFAACHGVLKEHTITRNEKFDVSGPASEGADGIARSFTPGKMQLMCIMWYAVASCRY